MNIGFTYDEEEGSSLGFDWTNLAESLMYFIYSNEEEEK
jgi:hypothetical protein